MNPIVSNILIWDKQLEIECQDNVARRYGARALEPQGNSWPKGIYPLTDLKPKLSCEENTIPFTQRIDA